MLRVLHNTQVDFIRRWKPAIALVALFILPSLVLIPTKGFNFSIEFTGGTLLQVEFAQTPDLARIRSALTQGGIPGVELTTFGSARELQIRAQASDDAGAEVVSRRAQTILNESVGAGSYKVLRADAIGPKVGGELRRSSMGSPA